MAEAVIRHRIAAAGLTDSITVDSAGTDGWHIGEDADERALATLNSAGYSLNHTGRQIVAEWFDPGSAHYADLVLTMDASNYQSVTALAPDEAARDRVRMLRSFDPALAGLAVGDPRLDVPDPYYGGEEGFDRVLDLLEDACGGLLDALMAERAGG